MTNTANDNIKPTRTTPTSPPHHKLHESSSNLVAINANASSTPTAGRHRRHGHRPIRAAMLSSLCFGLLASFSSAFPTTAARSVSTRRAGPLRSHRPRRDGIRVARGEAGASASSASAADRLRVDLARSRLSASMAEQKARRLEVQLREMRGECERVKEALARRESGIEGGRLDEARRSDELAPTKTAAAAAPSSPSTPFTGNSFDGLPPFAAALAANAERQEMEKRRRLGLIEEAELEDLAIDITTGLEQFENVDLDLNLLGPSLDHDHDHVALSSLVVDLEAEDDAVPTAEVQVSSSDCDRFIHPASLVNNTQQTLSSLLHHKNTISNLASSSAPTFTLAFAQQQLDNSTSTLPLNNSHTNLFSTPNNDTTSKINSHYTPSSHINDSDIQTLRQKCALLTRQKALLQQKLTQSESLRKAQRAELKSSTASERVLRGLQADWTRRLSEMRREMDAQKEEQKREAKLRSRRWQSEKNALEERLARANEERDDLATLLENQKDIRFVASLLCALARRHARRSLGGVKNWLAESRSDSASRTGRRPRRGRGPGPNRTPTVGGAREDGEGERRRGPSFRGIVRRERSGRGPRDETATGARSAPDRGFDSPFSATERMPRLMRKNPRGSRLCRSESVFGRRAMGDPEVPEFMRDG